MPTFRSTVLSHLPYYSPHQTKRLKRIWESMGSFLWESICCLAGGVWFPGNLRLHLFCQTKGKKIYAGLTELPPDFLEYWGGQIPLRRVLRVPSTWTFIELGRISQPS